jgi:GWxTD domain-containing protein
MRVAILAMISLGFFLGCAPGVDFDRDILARADSLLAMNDSARAVTLLGREATRPHPSPYVIAKLGELLRLRRSIASRLESQRVLERGLRIYPGNPKLTIELGRTYYEQTFYGDAEKCFLKAARNRDTRCEAYHCLGLNSLRKWLRNQNHLDELREAREYFELAVRCNPDSISWLFELAFVTYAQHDSNRSSELCSDMIRLQPDRPRPYLLLGAIAFGVGDYQRADSLLSTALSLCGSAEREHLLDISALCDEELGSIYGASSATKRDLIRKRFWIQHDPDPTTSLNEAYLEHIIRVFLADLYFSPPHSAKKGSTTDRGTALIKLGWPDERSFDLGEDLEGRNENWVYFLEDSNLSMTFQDEFLNDDFSIPTSNGETKRKLDDAPYRPPPPAVPLRTLTAADVLTFRNKDATATVVTVMHSVWDDSERPEPRPKAAWKLRTSVFDDRWAQAFHSEELLRPRRELCYEEGIFFLNSIRVPFDVFHAFFSLDDASGSIRARSRLDFSTLGYLSDSLMLSDIALLEERSANECKPMFIRSGEELCPAGSHDFSGGEKLSIYFEIYNLSLRGSGSDYDVTYLVYPYDSDKGSLFRRLSKRMAGFLRLDHEAEPAVSQTLHRRESGETTREKITLDVASLPPGNYELLIIVEDNVSGASARTGTLFSLVTGSIPH